MNMGCPLRGGIHVRFVLTSIFCRRAHVLFTLFVFVFGFVSFVSLRLVYPMLPVSLDCHFVTAQSVFSNVYIERKWPLSTIVGNLFGQCYAPSQYRSQL